MTMQRSRRIDSMKDDIDGYVKAEMTSIEEEFKKRHSASTSNKQIGIRAIAEP